MTPNSFADYTLLEQIGLGGVATVYKARDAAGAIVAVKIFRDDLEISEELSHRFEQEYRTSLKVPHSSIIRYLDFGIEDNRPYLVMEFVSGTSLWHRVRKRGPLTEGDAVDVARQMASALDTIHEAKIIHRDVKPNNILLTPESHAYLVDLGMVKDAAAELNLTASNTALGTPFFMAPEQFLDARNVDARADIYGLAASIYFALTGKVPFKFRGRSLFEKKKQVEVHAPDPEWSLISEDMLHAIQKGMQFDPADRPKSAEQWVESLSAAVGTAPQVPVDHSEPARPERRSLVRHACHFAGAYVDADQQRSPARVINISTDGMGLVLERPLDDADTLRVVFEFIVDEDLWDYQCRVVHVQQISPAEWRHGCRVLESIERVEMDVLLKETTETVRILISKSVEE